MNKHLSTALYSIIKPLVGLMFRNGMSFGEFTQIAKHAYVRETEKELLASGQKPTTSSIAISTGLTRKDVAILRKEASPIPEYAVKQNRATRVISGWVSDKDFCDVKGKANVLDIQGAEGSFENLVNRFSGDMPYQAILKELLRSEAVEIIDRKKVGLLRVAYIPSNDENGKYDLLGEDVSLLVSTIKHNINATDHEPRYQRKVSYNKIPVDHVEEFKTLANKENQLLLLKLNTWLAKHDLDNPANSKTETTAKVGVGVYYFEDLNEIYEVENDDNK